jgi:hypothetical protein
LRIGLGVRIDEGKNGVRVELEWKQGIASRVRKVGCLDERGT